MYELTGVISYTYKDGTGNIGIIVDLCNSKPEWNFVQVDKLGYSVDEKGVFVQTWVIEYVPYSAIDKRWERG